MATSERYVQSIQAFFNDHGLLALVRLEKERLIATIMIAVPMITLVVLVLLTKCFHKPRFVRIDLLLEYISLWYQLFKILSEVSPELGNVLFLTELQEDLLKEE